MSCRGWVFLLPGPESRLLADSPGKSVKAVYNLHGGEPRIFECKHMPFRLCNAPKSFQRLMQNCLGELSLMYCLICLDDMIVFSKTVEEHLFEHFQEHNLKLKLCKCEFSTMKSII